MTDDLNILPIKLHRPVQPPKSIDRPALIQLLNEGLVLGRSMTLVSAPAGFGKTSCVSDWLSSLALPAAWLSLDSDDNEIGRFFTHLFAALKKVGEALGSEAFSQLQPVEGMLRAGQLPLVEIIASALIADLANLHARANTGGLTTMPCFLLVLDDFHLIQEPFILKVFEKLIANFFQARLPQPLHLVLITREDPALPLARLRANNQLTEIRANELRFTTEETGRFLNEVMNLNLPQSDVLALEDRTEGWVVGLQLTGLSIRGRADPTQFINNLSGNHRFILSYLTEEVLSRQPDDIQCFLLSTSILDRLNGDLCNAVTGRADSHVLLEQLWNANLFLIPLDDEQHWYRYHHLFADLLRSRQAVLHGDQTAELHRRASRWFTRLCEEDAWPKRAGAKEGLIRRVDFAGEAIRHALSAAEKEPVDYAEVVQLVETHATEFIDQWYAKTVNAWIQALPAEWRTHSPRINLAFARLHLICGEFQQALPYLERLKMLFAVPGNGTGGYAPGLQAEWLALQSTLCIGQEKAQEALELARQALTLAPAHDIHAQCQVYLALAIAYQSLDDPLHAIEAFQKLILLGQASGDLITELNGTAALGLMYIESGRLHAGFKLATQGAERVERAGVLPPICAGIYGELGQVYYQWNQLDQAERYLERGTQVSLLAGFSDAEIYHTVVRSRLCQLRGDVEMAAREIAQAVDEMREDAPVVVREQVIAQQVRIILLQGNLASAEQLFSQVTGITLGNGGSDAALLLPDLQPGQRISYPQGVLYNTALRILLHREHARREQPAVLSVQGLHPAIGLANRLLEILLQRQYVPLVLETLLLRAQLHFTLADPEACLADFATVVDLAEPEGYISIFVEEGRPAAEALALLLQRSQPGSARALFVQTILHAFPYPEYIQSPALHEPPVSEAHQAGRAPAGFYEPLTDRELDVLRLIAEGRTYEEIADRLVVSINTVRTHVKSIYSKLGVNNRTGAIDVARQMGSL